MTAKPPTVAAITIVPIGLIALVALIDHLGKYRWFWPHDDEVYSFVLLAALLWYAVFGQQMRAWFAEKQTHRYSKEDETP